MSIVRALLLVAGGGAAGAVARWGLGELIPRDPGAFPWATLAVNLVGCALIGWCVRSIRGRELWLLVVTGGLGGFTTFSSFAVEVRDLVASGDAALAAAYVVASVAGGIAATRLGAGPPAVVPDAGSTA
jgi:fluoride exporter